MQCPNCHKEAINVNGKFVCLDCGIEISPGNLPQTQEPSQSIASINNHGPAQTSNNDDTSGSLIDPNLSNTIPIPDDSSLKSTTPIKDEIERELNTSSGYIEDFSTETQVKNQEPKEIPDFPVNSGIKPDPAAAPASPLTEKIDMNMDSSFTASEPVQSSTSNDNQDINSLGQIDSKDMVQPQTIPGKESLESLPQQPNIQPEIPVPVPNQSSSQNPSNLESENVAPPTDAPIQVEEQPTVPDQSIPEKEFLNSGLQQIDIQPEITPKESDQVSLEQPIKQENTNLSTPNQTIQAETYFQPQEVKIAPQTDVNYEANNPDPGDTLASEPVVSRSEISDGTDLAANQPKITMPDLDLDSTSNIDQSGLQEASNFGEQNSSLNNQISSTEIPQASVNNSTGGQNLDDLLDMYSSSGQDNIQPPIAQPSDVQPQSVGFDTLKGTNQTEISNNNVPSGQLPSFESVFGANSEDPKTPVAVTASKTGAFGKKKIFIIIAVVVLALLAIGGVTFGAIKILGTNKNTQENSSVANEEISVKVQNAMEGDISADVSYNQTISFSGIELSKTLVADSEEGVALISLKKTPATNNGTWKITKSGDTELNSVVNGVNDKKIFIKNDYSTYVYNNTTSAWEKKEGFTISTIPSFYGAESRGKLFYLAQIENIESAGQETVNGVALEKYKIEPNPDFVESIIKNSTPILSGANFTSLNIDNLAIFAWLDGDGKIYKVSVKGTVEVESDNFTGPISIQSEVEYSYRDNVEVKSPIAQIPKIKIEPVAVEASSERDVEVKPEPATVIRASEHIEGKG